VYFVTEGSEEMAEKSKHQICALAACENILGGCERVLLAEITGESVLLQERCSLTFMNLGL